MKSKPALVDGNHIATIIGMLPYQNGAIYCNARKRAKLRFTGGWIYKETDG